MSPPGDRVGPGVVVGSRWVFDSIPLRRNDTVVAHDSAEQETTRVAVIGDPCHPAVAQERLKASIDRPVGVWVAGVVRVEELQGQQINVGVDQQQPIPAGSGHVVSPSQGALFLDRAADVIVAARRALP